MSLDQLRGVLQGAGIELPPRELAEALWLARYLPLGARSAPDAPFEQSGEPGHCPPAGPAPIPAEAGTSTADTPSDLVPLHIPDGPGLSSAAAQLAAEDDAAQADKPVPAQEVRLHSGKALPYTLDLLRALRPLKRMAPAYGQPELDEEGTAQWYAEHRRWLPVMRLAPDRSLDLALVIDRSSTSAIWDATAAEFELLCRQLGAFRKIRTYSLVVDAANRPRLATQHPGSRSRSPRELLDPTRRTLTLILSDCVGAGWQSDDLLRILRRWARGGPVAILQPLPEHLWSRTNLPPVAGHLSAGGFARPNRELLVRDWDTGWRDLPYGDVAVPVLELTPQWLGPWARLVAGAAEGGIDGMLVLTGSAETANVAALPPADLPVRDRVLRFRAEATVDAYRLAGYLAVAPLHPAVMRMVQTTMLPRSRPAHLAEVLFSGLVEPQPFPGPEPLYDFVPGAREVLLGTLRKHEVSRVLEEVSAYVDSYADHGGSTFTIVAPTPDGEVQLSPLSRPFARVRKQVMHRLNGFTGPSAWEAKPRPEARSESTPGGSRYASLDGKGSRIVLIGGSDFADLSGSARTVGDLSLLADAFRGVTGHEPDRVTTVLNERDPERILATIRAAAAQAEEALLIHYAGPTTIDGARLFLDLAGVGSPQAMSGSLPFDAVVTAATSGRAATTTFVLDCGIGGAVLPEPKRGYLFGANAPSRAARLTAQLASLIKLGIPDGPQALSVDDAFLELDRRARNANGPRLWRSGVGHRTLIGPNRGYRRAGDSGSSLSEGRVTSAKLLICGGFGTGSTTFIHTLSEIDPIFTETILTSAGVGVDDTRTIPSKTTGTVAMDFGRITVASDLVLYLFGAPGRTRFWFMWDELVRGAVGAVVVVDTRRLADCFAAIDFFEHRRLPYLVAINCFNGMQYHQVQDVRDALAISPDVPVVSCDARNRESAKQVVISLVEYVLTMRRHRVSAQG